MLDFLGELLGGIFSEVLGQAIRWTFLLPFRSLRWCCRRLLGKPAATTAKVEAGPEADEAARSRPETV